MSNREAAFSADRKAQKLIRAAAAAITIAGAMLTAGCSPSSDPAGGSTATPPPPPPPPTSTTATPRDFGFSVPSPEPSLPAGVDPYSPPAANAAPGGPVFSETSDYARPGDTAVFAGDGFTAQSQFRIYSEDAATQSNLVVNARRSTQSAVAITLPAGAPSNAMALVYPGADNAFGTPIALNRTTARWIGPDRIEAGGASAVYGVNLAKDHGVATSFIYMKPAGASGQFLTPVSINPYRVEFAVPAGTAPGDYEIWTHNGHGGRFGWSGPLTLTVTAQSPWAGTEARVFDVRDYGAVGDGVTADDAAVSLALNAAEAAAPATVLFSAGIYLITRPRDIDSGAATAYRDWSFPNRVRMLGAGEGQTIIRASNDYVANANTLGVAANVGFFGFQTNECGDPDAFASEAVDLTIDGFTAFEGDRLGHQILQIRQCANLRFRNVTFNGDLDFSGTNHIFFDRVTFRGGVFLGDATQAFFTDSASLARADGDSITANGQEVAIIRHTARDLDPANDPADSSNLSRRDSGIGSGRLLVAQGGHTRNFYIGDSQTIDFAPSANRFDGNSGEQILVEHGGTSFAGFNAAFNGASGTLPGLNFSRGGGVDGSLVVIASGRGFGQRRTIVASDSASGAVTLDRPFTVAPDASSFVVVEIAAENFVVYRNRLQGKADYASRFTASTGVEPYGNSSGVTVDNNEFDQLRSAYSEFSLPAISSDVVGPQFFNTFINNRVTNGLDGLSILVGVFGDAGQNANIIANFGFHARDNTFDSLAGNGLFVAGPGESRMFVLERNRWTNVFSGLVFNSDGRAYSDNFLLNDSFTRGTVARGTAVTGNLPATATSAAFSTNATFDPTGTTFSGYSAGTPPSCTPDPALCP